MNKQGPDGIGWCDYTWNPIVGCSPISAGCQHCYAAAISRRFGLQWGQAHFMPRRLHEPAEHRKPSRVFVCSMSDLGHETVHPGWRAAVVAAMLAAPWHQYIVLTKRPGAWLGVLPPACWVGITAEDQENYDARWVELTAQVHGPRRALRFVSVEPMLGPISLRCWQWCVPDWVICGPETGPSARPFDADWLVRLAAESPCFFDKRTAWTRRQWPNV